MNRDDVEGHRRGSNRRWNTADEDRVKGRVVYEKEENSQENRWDEEHSAVGNEGENARYDSQETSGSANQKIAVAPLGDNPIGNPAAAECSQCTRGECRYAEHEIRANFAHSFFFLKQ